jgi:short-subunit dehydrogenase
MAKVTKAATLITGASTGIGKELAYLFAAERCPLFLVALPAEKQLLLEVAHECLRRGAASAEILALDLSESSSVDAIESAVLSANMHVGQLVNNAGFGIMTAFAEGSEQAQLASISVNVVALTALTRRFVPGMIARGEGGILNTASTGGLVPGPGMAVYFASKAFVLSLTHALEHELRGSGVTITALCPGPTVTAFLKRSGMTNSSMFKSMKPMTASQVAREGYAAFQAHEPARIAGLTNKLAMFALRAMPRRLRLNTIWRLHQPVAEG